jgi:hypothetical protein
MEDVAPFCARSNFAAVCSFGRAAARDADVISRQRVSSAPLDLSATALQIGGLFRGHAGGTRACACA